MGANTKIEWADHSWSPWRGCAKVSPGCANCYAEALSRRNPKVLGEWGKGRPRVLAKNWGDPLRWNSIGPVCGCGSSVAGECGCALECRNQRIFPSLCDWLDEEVPIEWLARFLELIHNTPHLDWLLLSKRPENFEGRIDACVTAWWRGDMHDNEATRRWASHWIAGDYPQNVWFGVSVEDQIRAEQRVPALLRIPARVRWLSLEPLLGPVSFGVGTSLDWFVVGGESGPNARTCDLAWMRSLVDQGRELSIPTFVKQLGSRPILEPGPISMETEDPKGGDPAEWPEDLRVREFPNTKPSGGEEKR